MEIAASFFTVITNIVLGLFTFRKNPNATVNRLFTFLNLQIAIWALANYFSLHDSSTSMTLVWIRLVMFDSSFMGPTIYLFIKAFPKQKLNIKKIYLVGIWLFAIITSIFALSPYMFTSVSITSGNVQPTPGPAIILFAINFIGFLILSFITLVVKFIRSKGLERNQIKFLLLGIIITFSLIAITNFLLVILFKHSSLVAFGPMFSLILIGFTSYAIVKHRLLDIGLIVARSVTYTVIALIFGGLFSFDLFYVGTSLLNIPYTMSGFILYGTTMLVVAFSFEPLKKFLNNYTDQIFYKGYYDSQKLLYTLSQIMSSTINLDLLTERILDQALSQMRITKGAFILFQKNGPQTIEYIKTKDYDKLTFSQKELLSLEKNRTIMLFEDLEEGEIKQIMRNLNISALLPLRVNDNEIGFFILGEKASGDIYSQQDIDILEILAPQLSVAIQNAKEYDEIKRFNVTLREEIDKATKDLKAANDRLRSLDRLKDEFVSLASHELRTPMTAISSYIWLVKKDTNLTDLQKTYLANTYESVQRLIRLVNDMLNVSRIESGRMIIKPQPNSIEEVVGEVMTELMPKAQEQKLTLLEEKPQQSLPKVMIDKDKIKEVIMNLVGNSLKFTPEGGKITISFSEHNDMVEVHVTDTGTGIKKEDMPKLFKKFGMIDDNYLNTTPGQGTGLGLYISKSIVQLHGGSIWFESPGEHQGTTFSFSVKKA